LNSIVFTLCSNNYLPFAKALGDSLLKSQLDVKFIIGLVDMLDPQVDYSFSSKFEILPCFDIGYPEFQGMLERYNIIEFNTAVKPFYFEYLFQTYPEVERIYYIDPDIYFYKGFEKLDQILKRSNIVLTPMITDPGKDSQFDELIVLRHGMFNLGFIGIKRSEESFRFINWWKLRLEKYCLIDKARGIFVDQKWIDLAPLFFEGIYVLKHKGYNMAWWNFNERNLIEKNGHFYVNSEKYSLAFFHFSGFKPGSNSITGRSGESRFGYAALPELRILGQKYEVELLKNGYNFLSTIQPSLKFFTPKTTFKSTLKRNLKRFLSFVS